eukprot:GAHX01003288.1.p1 GENE.GAHX01003288.1~~GAHX01003288.1.p1  ORF type:complete len:340 (+),score=57.55 GAHX01003288.1:92-1111(+)
MIVNTLVILTCNIFLYSTSVHNSRKTNIPYARHYNTNNLRLISQMNPRDLIGSVKHFTSLLFEYSDDKYKLPTQHNTVLPVLRNTHGFYILILDSSNAPSALFDILHSNPDTINNHNGLQKALVDFNASNNKLYFIIFHLTHVLIKKQTTYTVRSNVDSFKTFEITKKNINLNFETENSKFQEQTNHSLFTKEQYLIHFLTTSLKSKFLSTENILDIEIVEKNYWEIKDSSFSVRSLEANRINNKEEQLCFMEMNNCYGEIEDNEVLINFVLNFKFKRGGSELNFNVKYDSLWNSNDDNKGKVEILHEGYENFNIDITKVSKKNEEYVKEFYEEIINNK